MALQVRRLRTRDGRDQVVIDLVDFIALLYRSGGGSAPPELIRQTVERLRAQLRR